MKAIDIQWLDAREFRLKVGGTRGLEDLFFLSDPWIEANEKTGAGRMEFCVAHNQKQLWIAVWQVRKVGIWLMASTPVLKPTSDLIGWDLHLNCRIEAHSEIQFLRSKSLKIWELMVLSAQARYHELHWAQDQPFLARQLGWMSWNVQTKWTGFVECTTWHPDSELRRRNRQIDTMGVRWLLLKPNHNQDAFESELFHLDRFQEAVQISKKLSSGFGALAKNAWIALNQTPQSICGKVIGPKDEVLGFIAAIPVDTQRWQLLILEFHPEWRNKHLPAWMYTQLIAAVAERGGILDLWGLDDPGVAFFKETFCQRLEPRYVAHKVTSRSLKVLRVVQKLISGKFNQ